MIIKHILANSEDLMIYCYQYGDLARLDEPCVVVTREKGQR